MGHHRALLLTVSLAAFLTFIHTQDIVSPLQDELAIQDDPVPKVDYRLPTTMYPTAYKITLNVTLWENFVFQGEATINVTVVKATKSIVLHHGEISIENVSITSEDKELQIERKSYDKETQKYSIDVKESLNAGDKIVLNFEYEGRLGDNMVGFYKSSYISSNNTVKWLAITQFQTTHARHAFPCFDEPGFKATFTIQMIRPKGYTVVSNMPISEIDEIEPHVYMVTFEESVPMSTYLVAFAVFDFDFTEKGSMNAWARPNARKQTFYALDVGYDTLGQLGILFKEDYKLPKMDMIAVPDFSAGAMENWGMITFRESRMLYDEKESDVVAQQNVASVIVHEITHMWFGNLLTPSWWSYLWLSEGFARYFQYFGTELIEPNWNMKAQFLVEQYQAALAVDAIETSKSLTREVATPSDISTIGDTITYSKGASIIRMMSHIIGSDKFYEALRVYIRDGKAKGIVEPKNLWTALQSVNSTKINIEVVMNTWTRQAGYPVLSVKVEKGKVTLHQQRFLLRNLKSTPLNTIWHIPITYTSKKNIDFNSTEVKYWMTSEQHTIDVDISDSSWIVFNVQQTGFYRVNYDRASWYRIINTLNSDNFEKIHVYNRAGIVDDLLNIARAGLLDYEVALDGLRYLHRERSYLPFKAAFRAFDYLTRRFSGDEANYTLYKKYVLSLIENIYESLGYEDRTSDDRLTVHLRRELNNLACKFGHKKCTAISLRYFRRWRRDYVYRIEPNQRPPAYCTGILYGDFDDWTHLWNHYKTSNLASEQSIVLNALGCSNNTDILEGYLHYAISSFEVNRIRKHDSQSVFSSVYSSSLTGANLVLDFVDKNHAKMADYYGGYGPVGSILSGASQYLSTQELVDKFERLIGKHSEFSSILQSLTNSLQVAKFELNWYKDYKDDIVRWIKANTELPDNAETTEYRLPGNVIPKKYILTLEPFFEPDFTFNGHVQIIANVEKKTRDIVLHASDITYHSVQVFVSGEIVNVTTSNKEKYDFLVITLEKELDVNTEVTIGIQFTGILNKDMRGFYRSSYIDKDGKKRWLAATHLEPVGARKMFPCFDEPAMKAVFAVDVTIPKGYHAISNTKAKEVVNYPETSKKWYRFEDTKIMSTYLLALVVSDFEVRNETAADKDYGVWARPGTSNETSYALSLMQPLVTTYEKLFKQDYSLTKLDMVALPDFVSGAMENWGLLTFKESNLLWHENKSSTRAKQSVTNVISHEITHQWFGNLVSPRWWKYVWLNEGFARYFQYFGTSHIKDNWDLESQFVVDQLQSVFESDALTSSHPMSHEVYSPAEISAIFDSISYAKAASVIRMIEKTFGSEVFYAALQQYLEARKFNVASPDDLYAALADRINKSSVKNKVYKFLDSWTTQAGYPVVNVRTLASSSRVVFSQERFLLRNETRKYGETIWHIPITWATESDPNFQNTKPQFWLTSSRDFVDLDNIGKWIIVNVQQAGFYRVNYDNENWERIINVLKSRRFEQINAVNRAALIDDLMNLARAGYVGYDLLFSATEYLENEQHHLPWSAFLNGLTYLDRKFEGQNIHEYLKEHVKKIMTPIVRKLIYQNGKDNVNTPHASKLLRMKLYEWACKYMLKKCSLNLGNVRPDERPSTYCLMGRVYWSELWDLYTAKSTIISEKVDMLKGLGCSHESKYLNKLLTAAITEDSEIRYQDSAKVFASVYESSLIGAKFVMEFMKTNLQKMHDYYGDYAKIKTIMGGLAKRISTAELYIEYKKLSDIIAKNATALKESLESYDDLILYELAWYNRNMPMISYWLETRYRVQDYRLPASLRPVFYNLSISIENENKSTFDGTVKIYIEVVEPTNKIVMNAVKIRNLYIKVYETPDEFSDNDPKRFHILGRNIIPESQKLIIYLDSYINVPKITVEIIYTGDINDRPKGVYRADYLDPYNNHRSYIATHFLPNYARMAFPCFDEPKFKARFKLSIRRRYTFKSLSNMPLENSLHDFGDALDIYKESPIMSTYLVAFVVSNFEPIRNEKETFNVWGDYHNVHKGSEAQYAAYKYYNTLRSLVSTQVEKLEKIDMVGLPNFPISAMSNWGLINFQSSVLFYDEDDIPLSQKYSSLTTIARQVAHTYFGNLVTCEWWSHVWLDQGLAQYFQWLLLEKGLDERSISDYFVVNDMHDVMQLDIPRLTHALNYPVAEPDSLRKPFDKISSKKAASLIRMFHRSFDGSAFYFGMEEYVHDNQYKAVNQENLWDALQKYVKDVSVKDIMESWVNNLGYPLVSVFRNRSSGVLTISQRPFRHYDKNIADYHIPISMASELYPNFENKPPIFWLTKEEDTLETPLTDHWFIVNVQQSGYYRVHYDDFTWQRIIEVLNSDDYQLIHVINRAQIIDDLFNLARINKVSYEQVFRAALYLRREKEYLPWKAFERGINYLWEDMKIRESAYHDTLERYVLYLTSEHADRLGFDDRRDANIRSEKLRSNQLNRELILSLNCKFGNSTCIRSAMDLFNHTFPYKYISRNAKPAVLCTAMKHGDVTKWDNLWTAYLDTSLHSEQLIYLDALGCTESASSIRRYLRFIFDKQTTRKVRREDIPRAFASIYQSSELGWKLCYEYIVDNYMEVYDIYKDWDPVAKMFIEIILRIPNIDIAKKFSFFINNNQKSLEPIFLELNNALDIAMDTIRQAIIQEFYIIYELDRVLEQTEKRDKPNISTTQTSNIFLVALLSMLPFLLVR